MGERAIGWDDDVRPLNERKHAWEGGEVIMEAATAAVAVPNGNRTSEKDAWKSAGSPVGTPPTGSTPKGDVGSADAKKQFCKIRYGGVYELEQVAVGYLMRLKQKRRESGVEAWSLRVHHDLREVPFERFCELHEEDGQFPFHLICYFRAGEEIIWESEKKGKIGSVRDSYSGSPMKSPTTQPEKTCLETVEPTGWEPLPDECWMHIFKYCRTRELCALAQTCQSLHRLAGRADVWYLVYEDLYGQPPDEPHTLAKGGVRRVCRRSELRASHWYDLLPYTEDMGPFDINLVQMDGRKIVGADGPNLRIWTHSGRRVASMKGQSGVISCFDFDADHILSGCDQNTVKLWSVDELKCVRTFRGHDDPPTSCLLVGSVPITASLDGTIRMWESTQNMPVFTIQAEAGVVCMAADEAKSKLFSGGPSVDVWDIASAQKVSQLVSLFEDDEAKLVPLNSMSYSQNLLAGGSVAGTVSLWDTRTSELCFSFGCSSDGLRSSLPIRQVQVDDWKLACIAGEGTSSVLFFDIRSLGSKKPYLDYCPEPFMKLQCNTVMNSFHFHGTEVIAGCKDRRCRYWTFSKPAEPCEEQADSPELSNRERKKKGTVPKVRGRYPKRRTR